MKLIVGGANQGKLALAVQLARNGGKKPSVSEEDWESRLGAESGGKSRLATEEGEERLSVADGKTDEFQAAFRCRIVDNLHEYIRRLGTEAEIENFLTRLLRDNPDAILVCNEVGCGIVPMEKADRLWRESVGNACQFLAREADQVYRVICGLPQKIKG